MTDDIAKRLTPFDGLLLRDALRQMEAAFVYDGKKPDEAPAEPQAKQKDPTPNGAKK